MSILLEVKQLRYAYGNRAAVDGVDLNIATGELFGLLGPNGAGKSTTISCLSGLLTNFTGQVEFEGQTFAPASSVRQRHWLGVVPQDLAIYEGLTATENLRLFGELAGLRGPALSDRVERMLELSGFQGRERDLVSSFSGGMKRRLNLAVGVIHHPRLLLLDEPTVGVDPQSRNHLFESLQALKQSGMTMLYTTHYMEEAERLCDRIAIMNAGRIVAVGTAAELARAIGQPDANLEQVFLQLTGRRLRDE